MVGQEHLFLTGDFKLKDLEEQMQLENYCLAFILLVVSKKNHHNLNVVGKKWDEKQNTCRVSP